jgi:hypothetical protein
VDDDEPDREQQGDADDPGRQRDGDIDAMRGKIADAVVGSEGGESVAPPVQHVRHG